VRFAVLAVEQAPQEASRSLSQDASADAVCRPKKSGRHPDPPNAQERRTRAEAAEKRKEHGISPDRLSQFMRQTKFHANSRISRDGAPHLSHMGQH
jgi:hypothetical protein